MADAMPKDQMEFINAVEERMKDASNLNDADRYRFAFLLWQHKEWIWDFFADNWVAGLLKEYDKPVPTGVNVDELFPTGE